MAKRFVFIFRYSSAAILCITAIAKLISATGRQGVLNTLDPVLDINVRYLLILLAAIELVAMLLLLRKAGEWFSCLFVSMLGAQFLLYHIIFGLGHYNRGCPCLGTIAQRLQISQINIDKALLLAAAWLFIGGFSSFCFLSPFKATFKGN